MRLKPRQILYISCNPATQAPNIRALTDYQPIQIQPVDQFPHTPHIENIVLLTRCNLP
jgi:23S rRNA (uracil1939-C5)-methyltransferase